MRSCLQFLALAAGVLVLYASVAVVTITLADGWYLVEWPF